MFGKQGVTPGVGRVGLDESNLVARKLYESFGFRLDFIEEL
jgi:hypothetical protein